MIGFERRMQVWLVFFASPAGLVPGLFPGKWRRIASGCASRWTTEVLQALPQEDSSNLFMAICTLVLKEEVVFNETAISCPTSVLQSDPVSLELSKGNSFGEGP